MKNERTLAGFLRSRVFLHVVCEKLPFTSVGSAMTKRAHESDDLLGQLKLACSDPLRVRQILESQNIATIADVVTTLLIAPNSDAPIHAKHQKKV